MQGIQNRKPPDPVFVLRGTEGGISSVDFCETESSSRFKDRLVTGNVDGTINIWDLVRKRPVKTIAAHKGNSVLYAKILKDGKLLSHGRDGKILLWNIEEEQTIVTSVAAYAGFGFCPTSLLELGQTDWIAYPSSSDSQVNIVCLQNREDICKLKPKENLGMVMSMKMFASEDSSKPFVLIGYENGAIHLWDTVAGKELGSLRIHDDPVMCLDLDSRQERIATGSADKILSVVKLNIKSANPLQQMYTCDVKQPGIASVRVRDDCKIVAVGGWDGRIRIFGWKRLKPLAVLKYHTETVNCLTFSSENLLAAGNKDGKVSLWSIYTDS